MTSGAREDAARAQDEHEGRDAERDLDVGVLEEREVATRWGPGQALSETAPFQLLRVVSDFVSGQRFLDFAALVRHPDIAYWLAAKGVHGDWLTELDRYQAEHLPYRLSGKWLGTESRSNKIREVYQLVSRLVRPLLTAEQPLDQWLAEFEELLLEVYESREFDRNRPEDESVLACCQRIHETLASFGEGPDGELYVLSFDSTVYRIDPAG